MGLIKVISITVAVVFSLHAFAKESELTQPVVVQPDGSIHVPDKDGHAIQIIRPEVEPTLTQKLFDTIGGNEGRFKNASSEESVDSAGIR